MTDEFWDDNTSCPVCGKEILSVAGPKNAQILMVSDEPSDNEIAEGKVFVGQSFGVLRTELSLIGIDLRSCRRMTMWQHAPAKGKGNKNVECLKHGVEEVIKECKGRSIVVLLGAKVVETFLQEGVSAVSGLPMKSNYFSATALPCIAPGNVFRGGVGELRFALRALEQLVKELDVAPVKKQIIEEIVEDW